MPAADAGAYGPSGSLDDKLEVLAAEPEVRGTHDFGRAGVEPGVREHRPALFLQAPVGRLEARPVERGEGLGHRRHPGPPGRGARRSPRAEATPADGGQTTRSMPSRAARYQAWTGPAPPVARRT